MTDVVLPKSLTPGTPENISDVWDNLVALRDKINGGLDLTNLQAALQQMFVQPGTLILSGADAVLGYLVCDGNPYPRSVYATLFGVIGSKFGPGDGSSTFNVPDLRGSVPVGKGTQADVDTVGDHEAGAIAVARAPIATRGPRHHHDDSAEELTRGNGSFYGYLIPAGGDGIGVHWNSRQPTSGGGLADTPAFQVVNFFIKT